MKCRWCYEEYENPIHAVECWIEHFKLYEPSTLQYWRGNMQTFGVISGLLASIVLTFPFTTVFYPSHWRTRKMRLEIGDAK